MRRRKAGELSIEQTRDLARVRAMLGDGGLMTEGVDWPAACYLVAYAGDEAVGVIGVEPKLDRALIRSLYVAPAARRRGVGAALVGAARKAAHTRGARSLYLFSSGTGRFFETMGFAEIPVARVVEALRGTPQVDYYRARPDELAREVTYHLDISEDGVIRR
ncbi:MAG: GNAT family N-acetyltransferase [Candidatus Binataceae bacterium]